MLTQVEQREFDSVFNPKPFAIDMLVIRRFTDCLGFLGTILYLALAVTVGAGVAYMVHGKMRLGGEILLGVATVLVLLISSQRFLSENQHRLRAAYARVRLQAWFEERIGALESEERVYVHDVVDLRLELERYKSAIFSKLMSCDENAPAAERQMAAACAQGTFREAIKWWHRECLDTKKK